MTTLPKLTNGLFISFEGIDGAGKSSHIEHLANFIRAQGKTVVCTREPGGTTLGEKLRTILLNEPMHFETETLLMFAARSEHLAQVIQPALARGEVLLCDRFSDATYAYQGGGRGLAKEKFAVLEKWVHENNHPNLTFLFDLPLQTAAARMHQEARVLDRFEEEKEDFHGRVKNAYLERAKESNGRIKIIDSTKSIVDIRVELEKIVLDALLNTL